MSKIPVVGSGETKEKKSGIYTRTETSRKIPDDLAIVDNINAVFQQLRKRDATQEELAVWLPSLRSKYKSKDGASKTTIKYTYKNEIISLKYNVDNKNKEILSLYNIQNEYHEEIKKLETQNNEYITSLK